MSGPEKRREEKLRVAQQFCATPGTGRCLHWCGTHCGPRCCASGKQFKRRSDLARQANERAELLRSPPGNAANGAALLVPLESEERPRRVLLWQGERNDGRLGFMYWPVMSTLLEGFRHARGIDLRAGVGLTLEWNSRVHNLSAGRYG